MNITINNPASVKVSRVLIHLQQNETTTSLDLKGHRVRDLSELSQVMCSNVIHSVEQNQHNDPRAMDLHRCKCCLAARAAQSSGLMCLQQNKKGDFPVCRTSHAGVITVDLPETLALTEVDRSTCFAREYFVALVCEIPYHNPLRLSLPVHIRS